MIFENASEKKYSYGQYEGYESRVQRRLKNDLGIDETAAEAVLHLRAQILELQSRIRQMESELNAQHFNDQLRLAQYREVYYEAAWVELEFEE